MDVAALKEKWEAGQASPVCSRPLLIRLGGPLARTNLQDDRVIKHINKFNRTSSHPYTIITPSTSLPELEEFLRHNVFAIGASRLDLASTMNTDVCSCQ